jgi:putative nucleotidyltransferase with HDIG domain
VKRLYRHLRSASIFGMTVFALALLYTAVQIATRVPRQIPSTVGAPSPRTYTIPADFSLVPRARIPLGSRSAFVSLWSSTLNSLTAPPTNHEPPVIPLSFSVLASTTDPGVLAPLVPDILNALNHTLLKWGDRFLQQGEARSLFLSSLVLYGVPISLHEGLWETFLNSSGAFLEYDQLLPVGAPWEPLIFPAGATILRKGERVEPRHMAILKAIPEFLAPLPSSRWLFLFLYESVLFLATGLLVLRLPGGKRLMHAPYFPRVLVFYLLYPLLRFAASFSPVSAYTGGALVLMVNQADEWAPSFLPIPFFILHYAAFIPHFSGIPVPSAQDLFVALLTYLVFQFVPSNRLLYSALTAGFATYLGHAIAYPAPYEKLAYAGIVVTLSFVLVPSVINALLDRLYPVLSFSDLSQYLRPTHPLLRQLSERAPGTYAHAYRVAELAARAAEACGANPVVARAGALYHDIGKILNPGYFTENQEDASENPHNHISPVLSASIIRAHVLEGEKLARKHRLPSSLIRFIRTHHGDQKISFFYEQALKGTSSGGSGTAPTEADFRYPGPRPASAEEAIVMLADSTEATVRSRNPQTEEELNSILEQVLMEKIHSGQLSEARLTLQQLYVALDAMKRVLLAERFRRIGYPSFATTPVNAS